MEPRKNIEVELMELSPMLAQSSPTTPYEVPAGYFEHFAEAVLERVQVGGLVTLKGVGKGNPYAVPDGYFDGLADKILNRIKANDALSASDELEFLSPVLGRLKKENPYTLPEGYFEELASNITDGAKAIELVNEELENLSPLMTGLKGKQVYEVPLGYFDTLPALALEKAKLHQPGKVVSLSFGKRIFRYASAAVVAGLLFMAGWMYLGNKTVTIKDVSDSELNEYVETQVGGTDVNLSTEAEVFDLDANDVKDMLADVSDEELQRYMEQSGENNNSITN